MRPKSGFRGPGIQSMLLDPGNKLQIEVLINRDSTTTVMKHFNQLRVTTPTDALQ